MKTNRRTASRGGFTLLEVLLVLAILGVIAAMVVPQLLGSQKKAMIDTTKASINGLESALSMYAIAHEGEYPMGNQNALTALLEPTDPRTGKPMTPYLDKLPADAWGQPFFYEYPNTKNPRSQKPAIWSGGPNKQNEEGSNDDVTNWTP